MCIEEKQIGINYEIMVLLATFNNKPTYKISMNFKFYNIYIKVYINMYSNDDFSENY